MKFKKIVIFLMIFAILAAFLPVNALAASSSMSGPGTVRYGDTIYVKFTLSSLSNVEGIEAKINFSDSYLTYKSAAGNLSSPWVVEVGKDSSSSLKIIAYDNKLTSPLSGTKNSVYFKILRKRYARQKNFRNSSNIKVSINKVDYSVTGSTYSKTHRGAFVTNANLASLSVSNAKVYPSFSSSCYFI
jgi:hypothetical protein